MISNNIGDLLLNKGDVNVVIIDCDGNRVSFKALTTELNINYDTVDVSSLDDSFRNFIPGNMYGDITFRFTHVEHSVTEGAIEEYSMERLSRMIDSET